MRKRIIIILTAVIIVGALAAAGIYTICKTFEIDRENEGLIVKKGIFSGYSYEVYEDHVRLLEYHGEEKYVTVPETLMGKTVTVIGERCFAETEIESVNLSADIREIELQAFQWCNYLEMVTGDAEVEYIGTAAFSGCDCLKMVELGNSIKRIEGCAFYMCSSLESIGEQPELEYIGGYAFEEGGTISDFWVPEYTEVGEHAFRKSKWLENRTEEFVIVGNGSLLGYNGSAELVKIPYGVTKLDQTFTYSENAKNIREIYLPETVTELISSVFWNCEDFTVYIPESVTEIGSATHDSDSWYEEPAIVKDEREMTIVTTAGSFAEEYAKKYRIKCEIVDEW